MAAFENFSLDNDFLFNSAPSYSFPMPPDADSAMTQSLADSDNRFFEALSGDPSLARQGRPASSTVDPFAEQAGGTDPFADLNSSVAADRSGGLDMSAGGQEDTLERIFGADASGANPETDSGLPGKRAFFGQEEGILQILAGKVYIIALNLIQACPGRLQYLN